MSEPKDEVIALLRSYAKKAASTPDRMTVADGQGGISTHAASPKKDSGEDELKQDQPADGTGRKSNTPASSPDRMTVADGQGGISTNGASPKKDPGEDELKKDQPADGAVRKSARVEAIRSAIFGANAALAPTPTTKPAATGGTQKQAAGNQIDIGPDVLAKIASAILSTEEGINFTHSLFEKQAGEAAARVQIQEAIQAAQSFDNTEQVKSAAYDDVFTKAAAIYEDLSQLITEDDADSIIKTAHAHQEAIISLDHPLLKQAYAAGMDDAALMEAAAEAEGGGGEEGAPPVDEALPMGGEDLSEEEILALLEEMIASGEISEEDVMAALQATEGGEGGGELPPEAMAPEGLPMG